jgi:hypothetical protein
VGERCGRLGRTAGNGVVVATAGIAFAGEAWGSGFQLRQNSASALGNAFAGAAASTEDPSIIANNPAGMIGLSGNQVSGDMSIIIPSVFALIIRAGALVYAARGLLPTGLANGAEAEGSADSRIISGTASVVPVSVEAGAHTRARL